MLGHWYLLGEVLVRTWRDASSSMEAVCAEAASRRCNADMLAVVLLSKWSMSYPASEEHRKDDVSAAAAKLHRHGSCHTPVEQESGSTVPSELSSPRPQCLSHHRPG